MYRLVPDFRFRGPLDRSASEIEALFAGSAGSWPRSRDLSSRAGDYTRTRVYVDSRFEIVLLNWAEGAVSPIHDHGGQHCWMYVLEGAIDVADYARLDAGEVPGYAHVEPTGSCRLGVGEIDLRSGPYDLHRVSAAGSAPAVSLHVYAAPLRQYLVYDENARRCQAAFGRYDAILSGDLKVAG
ncbi:MAG TPA: cysteine dioxygenase family protein [Candidatus Cybelea sp.]|nr:cysteine dioxygenase family protein [Candidatus Cybelea sp.]